VTGIISSTNSLLGTSANDNLGSGGVTSLSGDLFLIRSPQYDNGAVDTGRLQIGSATSAGGGGSVGPGMVPVMFGDNLGGDVTVTALQITAITDSGTAVVLQASNDLTINSDIVSNNIAGAGGDLIFEAGRSVIINADIFTDDGLLDITANSDLVNGVIDADRLLGPAMISMADGTTLNSGLGDLIITLESGSGLSNTEAGDMVLENIIANHIDLTVNSQTDNSDILRASADALITASSLFIDHDPIAGNGGSIGTASEPLLVQVNNLSAHTHANSPGIFINSADPGQDVILGDTFFGLSHFIQGVETVASGNIVLNIAGNVTVNKTVLSAGDLDINTTGTSSNLVVNAPISATSNLNMNVSGDIVITDVTVNGAAGVQSSSGSLQLISNLAPVQLTSSGNLNIDNTGNLILQGSDTSSGGSAKVLAEGEIIINAASVNLNAGDADFAFASIDPLLLELTLSGDLNLTGGAGQMSDAQLQADTVNIMTTGNVNLTAGTGDDSSAIINGQASDVTIDAAQIELQAGTGANADALVIADLGNGNINVMAPTCTNCDPIDADPILDATAQNGFFGIQVAQTATTDVPDNQQVVVLESFTDEINEEDVTSVTAINTVTTEDGDEEEEEELLECRA
jgi:hypothetical protein